MASTFLSAAVLALAATTVSASSVTLTPGPHPTLAARAASETTSPLPLTAYTYAYEDVPYKVNPYAVGRGPQSGYNQVSRVSHRKEQARARPAPNLKGDGRPCASVRSAHLVSLSLQCNSTTEGPDSQCQTALLNSIDE